MDIEVESRLNDRVRRKWIIKLQERIIELTGVHSRLFMKLDSMLDEQRRDRERHYFNVGYELGRAAACNDGGRPSSPQQERAALLLREFKTMTARDGIPSKDVTVALLRDVLATLEGAGG